MPKRRAGSALIEFTLMAIPVLFLSLSIVQCSIAMWEFNSLSNAVTVTARYVSLHGAGCSRTGNTCTLKLKDVANLISQTAPILDVSRLNVTLYTNSATTPCTPLNTCQSSTAQFPSTSDNAVGMDVKIVASYRITNPMPMYWPPRADIDDAGYTLGATSRQRIQF